MKKFWNKQCEMARTMMKSKITNDYIIQEYNKTSVDEWDKMCVQIDTLLRNHNAPINDSRWDRMIEDFSVVASGNNVDKTVLYVAFQTIPRKNLTDEAIEQLAKKTIDYINNAKENPKVALRLMGIELESDDEENNYENVELNALHAAILKYPQMLNDVHVQKVMKSALMSARKDHRKIFRF